MLLAEHKKYKQAYMIDKETTKAYSIQKGTMQIRCTSDEMILFAEEQPGVTFAPATSGAMTLASEEALSRYPIVSPCYVHCSKLQCRNHMLGKALCNIYSYLQAIPESRNFSMHA